MNVLITSASRKVALVKAFQEALRLEGGGKVIAADISGLSPALYAADQYAIVPRSHSPEFVKSLLGICGENEVRLLVPTRDEELPLFAECKDVLQRMGTRALVSDPMAIRICQDKREFVQFCTERRFAVPRTFAAGEKPTASDFPVFVKPRRGKGGKGAVRVDSPGELEILLAADSDLLIQENVGDKEFTVDLFADFSGTIISVVPRERTRVFGGESFVSRTLKNPILIDESSRLATALRLTGHVTIQCFFDGKRVRFIEVNPRFGGAANLGFAAGAPSPHFLIKLLKGEKLVPRIGDFKDDLVMLRYTEDMFLLGSECARDA